MPSQEELDSQEANRIAAEKVAFERADAEKAEAQRIADADKAYKASPEYAQWQRENNLGAAAVNDQDQ